MVSDDNRLVLVFNGEIYNYPKLRKDLEAEGIFFRTTSDSEVLLHLYARDGEAMVHKLRGMFAFAIWDAQKRGLFLARDPYGIKPLYTANDGWTFRFASQVKALLAGGKVSRDPEPAGLVGFRLYGSVPDPFTLYREIRALPAGHTQWVDTAGPREPRSFANLAEMLASGNRCPVAAAEIPSLTRNAVLDSVRAHLLSDVPVGVFLSAGVDSGALLGLMRDAGQRDVAAITLAFGEFGDTEEDEAPLAAKVAAQYDARHIVRRVAEKEFLADLPAILDAMDQPSIDGINTWFISKAAREAGLKVAISGLGGDELLAGYASFTDLPRWRRRLGPLATVPGLGSLARRLLPALAPGLIQTYPKAAGLLNYANSWAGLYLLRRGLYLPEELNGIMDPEIAREGMRRLRPLQLLAAGMAPDPGCDVSRVCALESSHYMRNTLLRDADWAGMAHSLEIRVPLVDTHLLTVIAGTHAGLSAKVGKAALAGAPSLQLPAEILSREKTGFGVPTGHWMNALAGNDGSAQNPAGTKGLVSRRWSDVVLKGLTIAPDVVAA